MICFTARRAFTLSTAILALAAGCGGSDSPMAPPVELGPVTPVAPGDATPLLLTPGSSAVATLGTGVHISGGQTGGEYALVVTDTSTLAGAATTVNVAASGIMAPGSISAPSTSRSAEAGSADLVADMSYGGRLNARAARTLRPRFGAARSRFLGQGGGALRDQISSAAQVGDIVSLNVSENPCTSPVMRSARITAIGARSIVVSDTTNPAGGFTAAQFATVAARFDTLVYPLDVAAFGAPSDIDHNGRVILFFTRAVNELTPARSNSYVGGFFFDRDLFPATATASLEACAGSNQGELFYLLAPDPAGVVNGNVRRTSFVDSVTTSVVAHEFQHLINASRRLFVNTSANDFEVVWLNEGLSHIAEELLFYRESGLGVRSNLDAGVLGSATLKAVFNADQIANAARYDLYLQAPSTNSPVADNDSLETRGATWNWLRYLADRKATTLEGQNSSVWMPLVNSTKVGTANMRDVFGADLGGALRDWTVSHYTDDVVPVRDDRYTQPSWNWHSLLPTIHGSRFNGTYPLPVTPLTTAGVTGSVIPGGARYYRFSVAPNTEAVVTASGPGPVPSVVQTVIVRIR